MWDSNFIDFPKIIQILNDDIKRSINNRNYSNLEWNQKYNLNQLRPFQEILVHQIIDYLENRIPLEKNYISLVLQILFNLKIPLDKSYQEKLLNMIISNPDQFNDEGLSKTIQLIDDQLIRTKISIIIPNNNKILNQIVDLKPEILRDSVQDLIFNKKYYILKRIFLKNTQIIGNNPNLLSILFENLDFNPEEIKNIKLKIEIKKYPEILKIRNIKKQDIIQTLGNISSIKDPILLNRLSYQLSSVLDLLTFEEIDSLISNLIELRLENNHENSWLNLIFYIINEHGFSYSFNDYLDILKELKYYQVIHDFFLHHKYKIVSKSIDWILGLDYFCLKVLELNEEYFRAQDPVDLFKKILYSNQDPIEIIRVFYMNTKYNINSQIEPFNEILIERIQSLDFSKYESISYGYSYFGILISGLYLYGIKIDFKSEFIEKKVQQFYENSNSKTYYPFNAENLWRNYPKFNQDLKIRIFTNLLNYHYDALGFFALYSPLDFCNYIELFLQLPDENIHDKNSYMQVLISFLKSNVEYKVYIQKIKDKCKNYSNSYSKVHLLVSLNQLDDAIRNLTEIIINFNLKSNEKLSYFLDYLALQTEKYVEEVYSSKLSTLFEILEKIKTSSVFQPDEKYIALDFDIKWNYLQGRLHQIEALKEKKSGLISNIENQIRKSNEFFQSAINVSNEIKGRIKESVRQLININSIILDKNYEKNISQIKEITLIEDPKSPLPILFRIIPPIFSSNGKKELVSASLQKKINNTYNIVHEWDLNFRSLNYSQFVPITSDFENFRIVINKLDRSLFPRPNLTIIKPTNESNQIPIEPTENVEGRDIQFDYNNKDTNQYPDGTKYTLLFKNQNYQDPKIKLEYPVKVEISKTNYADLLISELVKSIRIIQDHPKILNVEDEPSINTILCEILNQSLNHYKLYCRESQGGLSATENTEGHRDFQFLTNDNNRISIMEAIKYYGFPNRWEEHLNRIWNYDLKSNDLNFLLIYYMDNEFDDFWKNYPSNLNKLKNLKEPLIKPFIEYPKDLFTGNNIKIGISVHNQSTQILIYHIAIKFPHFGKGEIKND